MGKRLQQLREVVIAPRMRTTKSPQPVFGNHMDSGFGVVSSHQHGIPDTCGGARKQKQFLIALILANIFEQFPLKQSLKKFHVMLLSRDIQWRHFEKFQLQHWIQSGADELEHATPLYSYHGVVIDGLIFQIEFFWNETPVGVPWPMPRNSSTSLRHYTGTAFLSQRKRYPKNWSVCKNAMT